VVDPSKKVPDLNCEVQDLLLEVAGLKQEVPDLRSVRSPPQFNPWIYNHQNHNGDQRQLEAEGGTDQQFF